MQVTPEIIMMVATAVVTAIFGILTKKFNWSTNDIIPVQNLVIGLLAGILMFLSGLNDNMLSAILLGIFASMCAGGIYDMTKIGKKNKEKEKEEEKWDNEKE